nr:MAG TPA: hypothetical protein [Caudoviricetes sp.]
MLLRSSFPRIPSLTIKLSPFYFVAIGCPSMFQPP